MAQQVIKTKKETVKKITSIGRSKRSRPKNKLKRRNWKRSRGQGVEYPEWVISTPKYTMTVSNN
tara:strand:- start:218 stop:409 length:192 start_codon:yes stop_codon:yes gene_type:complete